MDYEKLIRRILEIPVLKESIDNMMAQGNYVVNLVRPDWLQVLQNNPTYQDYLSKRIRFSRLLVKPHFKLQRVSNKSSIMTFIVAGEWYLTSHDETRATILSRNCPILIKIAEAFIADQEPIPSLVESGRFFPDICNPTICKSCQNAREKCNLKHMSSENQWCILKTKFFDGERVKNAFKYQILRDFRGSSFLGIMLLEVNTRYFFESGQEQFYKISGSCKDMIVFKETCISPEQNCELDLLVPDSIPPIEEVNALEKSSIDQLEECLKRSTAEDIMEAKRFKFTDTVEECIPAKFADCAEEKSKNEDYKLVSEKEIMFP